MEYKILFYSLLVLTLCSKTWTLPRSMEQNENGDDGVVNMQINEEQQQQIQEEPSQESFPTNGDLDVSSDTPSDSAQDAQGVYENEEEGRANDQQGQVDDEPAHIPSQEQPGLPEEELDWGNPEWRDPALQGDIVDQVVEPAAENVAENDDLPAAAVGDAANQDQQYGVVDPEAVMHGGDGHDHTAKSVHEGSEEDAVESQEHQARDFEARKQVENDELSFIQPKIPFNVHDTKARKAAEFMKDRQFGPDIEEIVHGGHRVHGEDGGHHGPIQAGGVGALDFGQVGQEEWEKKEPKPDGTVDPEELMHAGAGGHDHHGDQENPHKGGDEVVEKKHRGDIGIDVEKVIRGVHGEPGQEASGPAKNKVRYQDIIDLGLSEELLKGIDLSQLLEQEKREYDNYKSETKETGGDENTDSDFDWEQRSMDLRQQYLAKLYSKVRVLEPPDLEHAEWDQDDDGDVRSNELREGESQVEREMEMWGSTAPKNVRRPIKKIHNMNAAQVKADMPQDE